MNVLKTTAAFTDERGEIRDILQDQDVNSLTILTCASGSVRGNHYHKLTTQFTYIVSGKFTLYTQYEGEDVKTATVSQGDLVVSPPLERHAFEALEDSVILAGCYGPRSGSQYETDTYRLDVPISGRR